MNQPYPQSDARNALLRQFVPPDKRVLVVVAANAELGAIFPQAERPEQPVITPWTRLDQGNGCDAVLTGVGKANAAGATASVVDPARYSLIVSIGIGGALPPQSGGSHLPLGSIAISTRSIFADEGVQTPSAFLTCTDIGFPSGADASDCVPVSSQVMEALTPHADHATPIATVSTCSGTDALAAEVATRTGAAVEAMEGAAVGLVAWRFGIPFLEVRAISNTTGDRASQAWDVKRALKQLSAFWTILW